MYGSPPDKLMYESVTFTFNSIQNEVNVVVHQNKSKDDHVKHTLKESYAVHPVSEIPVVPEYGVNSIPICNNSQPEYPSVLSNT